MVLRCAGERGNSLTSELVQVLFTPTKTRVDQSPHLEAGVHPLPPGALAVFKPVGTHVRAGLSQCPALSCEQP